MRQKLLTLCLFMVTGRTYTFRDVEVISDNETAITFTYKAMSDDQWKTAIFFKTHLAGASKCLK